MNRAAAIIILISTLLLSGRTLLASNEVIYGVSPFYFSRGYNVTFLPELTRRIPEIKELGATIIWLQPLNLSHEPGQSYDVTDHMSLNPAYGNEADLKAFVEACHSHGLKVILDVALNHTSLHHPFAKDVIANGMTSRYFNFYQSQIRSDIPYSEHAHIRTENGFPFTYYFWDSLVNLNYDNSDVRSYALSVLEYWIKTYDVDGYRFDASWGPQSRWPQFYSSVNQRLRQLKPGVFLLAEDKAGYPARYEDLKYPHLRSTGFNAAYDWNASDPDWLSKWNFQTGEIHSETVFNTSDSEEAAVEFLNVIRESSKRQTVEPVRYLENNDTPSFLHSHSREQTLFASKVLFLLPGTPLLFYGQPLGLNYDQWKLPSIDPAKKLSAYDKPMWDHYKRLLELKKSKPALTHGKIVSSFRSEPSKVIIKVQSYKHKTMLIIDFAALTVDVR